MRRSGFKRPSAGTLTSSAPMKRSKPLTRSTPLKQRSKKMEKAYAGDADVEGRFDFVARILLERPVCEVGMILARAYVDEALLHLVLRWRPALCGERAVQVHEILRRSAGGSIVDDENVLSTCFHDHRWLHRHPRQALELGLLRSRYSK